MIAKNLKKAEKMQKIVNVAQKLFAEKGYHKTTVDEIVEQAEIAKGTFYLYFPDKMALFEIILTELSEKYKQLYERILQNQGTEKILEEFISTRLKVYQEYAGLLRLNIQSDVIEEDVKGIFLGIQSYHQEVATKIISKGIAESIFCCDDAFFAAVALNGMINQAAINDILMGKELDALKITISILQIFFQGIKKGQGAN